MDSLVEGQETDQLPPGPPRCGHPMPHLPWAEGNGAPALCRGLTSGAMAGLGFVGRPKSGLQTPVPGGRLVTPTVTWTGSLGRALGARRRGPSAGQGHTGARLCLLARGLSHPPQAPRGA